MGRHFGLGCFVVGWGLVLIALLADGANGEYGAASVLGLASILFGCGYEAGAADEDC